MKALKNESKLFFDSIITAVTDCYATTEPSNTELTKLYFAIGKSICEQGEKAFVVHLAETLAAEFPAIKGFSARNLRRMRGFYSNYESKPRLLQIALELGWTQNAVVLDCCETDGERAFYTELTAEKNLSKLALMRAIESGTFEQCQDADNTENDENNVAAIAEPVCDFANEEATDTQKTEENGCAPNVTACEPFMQEISLKQTRKERTVQNPNNIHNVYDGKHRLLDLPMFYRQGDLKAEAQPPSEKPPPPPNWELSYFL